MRRTAALAVLLGLALLLLAGPAPAASAPVCESYGHEECLVHRDTCVSCRAFDRLDLCVEPAIAAKLPKGEPALRCCPHRASGLPYSH